MRIKKSPEITKRIKNSNGFTLFEALFSVVLLGFMASGVSVLYVSGLQTLDEQADRMVLDSYLRSRMEFLVGQPFAQLANGNEVVTVRGQNYTIDWTVVLKDLDGDMTPEATAKEVTVSVSGVSNRVLTTILVDNEDRLGKI
jgi:type II secretory pathway pseudopilin PulG